MRDAQPRQQLVNGLKVHGARRHAAGAGGDQHGLEYAQVHGRGQALRQVHDVTGTLGVVKAREVQPVQRRAARAGPHQAGQRLEQRGLAAAVRTQQRRHFARGKRGDRQVVQHVFAPVTDRKRLDRQAGGAWGGSRPCHGNCLRSTTETKKGMPTNAVTMPTGTTTPGMRFLDAIDASDRITAPTRALPGR